MNIFQKLGLPIDKSRRNEEIIYNIARTYLLIHKSLSEYLLKYNLNLAKFNILLIVKHIGKNPGISQGAISKFLLVTDSNMTRMIDKLENEQYLERIAKSGDRRTNLVRITEKGAKLLDTVWPGYVKAIDSIVGAGISDDIKETLNKSLALIQENIEASKK